MVERQHGAVTQNPNAKHVDTSTLPCLLLGSDLKVELSLYAIRLTTTAAGCTKHSSARCRMCGLWGIPLHSATCGLCAGPSVFAGVNCVCCTVAKSS